MTSDFDKVFSRFYIKIKDYEFANQSEEIMAEMLGGWLKSASSKPYIRRLFSKFNLDTDIGEIEYVMKLATSDDEDKDFIEEILAKAMVLEWLTPMVESIENTRQIFAGKETNYYSQANHLAELRKLYSQTKIDLRKVIMERGYIYNDYLMS